MKSQVLASCESVRSNVSTRGLTLTYGLALGLALFTLPAHAADEEAFSPDRPNFVNSPDPVGVGRFQIESGLAYSYDKFDEGSQRATSTPLMLRLGVARDLEFRLQTDGWQHVSTGGSEPAHASGTGDLSVSTKWRLRRGDESGPGLALIGQLDMPAGQRELHGDSLRPSLYLTSNFDLGSDWSLGVMPGVTYNKDDLGRFTAGSFGVALDKGFGSVHAFVELAAEQLAAQRHGGNQASFDTGMTWQILPVAQLDFALMRGLSHNTADWQGTVGFSYRF